MDHPENLFFDVRLRRRALNKGLVTEDQVNQLIGSLPDVAEQAVAVECAQPALAVPAPAAAVAATESAAAGGGESSSVTPAPLPAAMPTGEATAPAPPAPTSGGTFRASDVPAEAASGAPAAPEPQDAPVFSGRTETDRVTPTPPPPQRLSQPPQTSDVDSAWGGADTDDPTPATSQVSVADEDNEPPSPEEPPRTEET